MASVAGRAPLTGSTSTRSFRSPPGPLAVAAGTGRKPEEEGAVRACPILTQPNKPSLKAPLSATGWTHAKGFHPGAIAPYTAGARLRGHRDRGSFRHRLEKHTGRHGRPWP